MTKYQSVRQKLYWVVTPNFYPLWAGPSERFFRYAKISENFDLKIVFKTFDRGVKKRHEVVDDVEVFRYQTDVYSELLNKVIKEIQAGNKPDAVIIFGLDKKIVRFNRRLNNEGVNSIYVSTMAFNLDFRDNGMKRGWLRKRLYYSYFKQMLNSFNLIVSSSNYLSNQYAEELKLSPSRLRVIPNGVNSKVFHPAPNLKTKYRLELGMPEGELVFLYVGLMVERKGILQTLKAWKTYKNKGGKGFFACVGGEKRTPGDEKFFKEYLEIKELLMEDPNSSIHFFGTSFEVHKFFKASDVFVFMSRLEGMPNVLLEAMACGLPVVTNKFKGFSDDYGEEGVHYLSIEKTDPQKIIDALSYVSGNQKLREGLSLNSLKNIEKNFMVEESIKKYYSILSS